MIFDVVAVPVSVTAPPVDREANAAVIQLLAKTLGVARSAVEVRGQFTPDGQPRRTGRPMIAAARIQRMTRLFGVRIIASEETFEQVSDRVRSRALGSPKLKGLAHRPTLHEILGRAPSLAAEGR